MWILPSLRGNHISKSPGKMNVETFLYRDAATFAKVRVKWMWIPSYTEMYPHLQKSEQNECGYIPIQRGIHMDKSPFWGRNGLVPKRPSCKIVVKLKLHYYLLAKRQNVNKKEKRWPHCHLKCPQTKGIGLGFGAFDSIWRGGINAWDELKS